MKRFVCLLCMMALVIFAACAKKTTVEDVMNKTIEAQGGAANITAIKDQVGTWDMTMTMPPSDSTSTMTTMNAVAIITFKAPNKMKFETLGPDGTVMMTTIYDGANGWNAMMGQVAEMTEAEKQENATMAETWVNFFYDSAAKGMKAMMMPDTTIDGKMYHRVHATDRFGNASVSFCDAQTGLIERMEGMGTNPMDKVKRAYTMYFTDYAEIDGVKWSKKVTNKDADGNLVWEATLREAKHNTGVTDDVFAMPMASVPPAEMPQ